MHSVEDNIVEDKTPEWMFLARCRGMDPARFFPINSEGVNLAQRVCAECPVTNECLEYALANRVDNGIWGGASERRRRLILRRRTQRPA